jgi:hypothetical protein
LIRSGRNTRWTDLEIKFLEKGVQKFVNRVGGEMIKMV